MLLFGCTLLPPALVALVYGDGLLPDFSLVTVSMVVAGVALRRLSGNGRVNLRTRDGFILVVVMWLFSGLLGSVMFMITLPMGFTNALFESVSALTTTGATVITGLDRLPPSILFFRQELQWLGGIGVVVSAIALLPLLGVGGMQLFQAEAPGPVKDEKLAPRIAHTAAILWKIYLGLTAGCAVAYWFAGMSVFDAIGHSFSTVSTGGFSTHDASLGHFHSPVIEAVAIIFMLLGSINFGVHFAAWRGLSVDRYRDSEEVRGFFRFVLGLVLLVAALLLIQGDKDSVLPALRVSAFTVTSVITSTGFGIDNFAAWGAALPVLLMLAGFIGGCGGSTAGGMKVIRVLLILKSIRLEFLRLTHPAVSRPIGFQGASVDRRVLDGIKAFVSVYIILFFLLTLVLLGLGLDLETAASAVATSINNLGPGLGQVASHFQSVPESAKLILVMAMLLGRLEIFSLFVLFSPRFWKN